MSVSLPSTRTAAPAMGRPDSVTVPLPVASWARTGAATASARPRPNQREERDIGVSFHQCAGTTVAAALRAGVGAVGRLLGNPARVSFLTERRIPSPFKLP